MPTRAGQPPERHASLGNELALVIGANVERLRVARHLTKSKFSLMLGIGRPTLNAIERGTHNSRLSLVHAMADALGVNVYELLTPPEV